MSVVEVRKRPVQGEVVNVCRRAAETARTQATASCCAGGIHRHIVNGFAESVGETEVESRLKPAPRGKEETVVVRIAARILEEDLPELRVRAEVIGRKAPRGDCITSSPAISEGCQTAHAVELKVRDSSDQVGGAGQLRQQYWSLDC